MLNRFVFFMFVFFIHCDGKRIRYQKGKTAIPDAVISFLVRTCSYTCRERDIVE